MAQHYGPNIVTDGLVLCLDAADETSYPGEPTTNYINDNGIDMSVISQYAGTSAVQISDVNSSSGYSCKMTITDASGINDANRSRFGSATGIPTSGQHFISVYIKAEAGNADSTIYPYMYTGAAWVQLLPLDSGVSYVTTTYRRFGAYASVGTSSSGPNPGFSMIKGNSNTTNGDILYWHSPQFETKSHATPFVNGTRSATDGWKDLTANGNHGDLTNMTFDSDAQMDFDGSSGYVNCGNDPSLNISGDFTFNFWFNADSIGGAEALATNWHMPTNQRKFMFCVYDSSGYRLLYYSSQNGTAYSAMNTPAGSISSNTWHLASFQYNQSTTERIIYVDGVFSASDVSTYTSLYSGAELDTFIGTSPDDTGGRYFDGKIANVKIYNRLLSSKEVSQNFNAQRSRFSV